MARAKLKSRIVWVAIGVILTLLSLYVAAAARPIIAEFNSARAKVAAEKLEAGKPSFSAQVLIVQDKPVPPKEEPVKVVPKEASAQPVQSAQNEVVANLARAVIEKDNENLALKAQVDKSKAEGDALRADMAQIRKDFDALSKAVAIAPSAPVPVQPTLVTVTTWDASPQMGLVTFTVDPTKFVRHDVPQGKRSCAIPTAQLLAGVAVSAVPNLRIKVKFTHDDRGSWSWGWGGETTDLAAVVRDGKIVLPLTSDRVESVQFYCNDQPIVVAVMKQ